MTWGGALVSAKGLMFILSTGNQFYKYARSDS